MNKAFDTFLWENYPKTDTPLGKTLLNKINTATDAIDDRVIVLDNTKATKIEVSPLFKEVAYDERTGIITFTRKNGATVTIDTPMEKIALNIYYDPVTEMLALPLIDGTQMQVDLSRLITEYEFLDSDTIAFSIKPDGKVSAIVKEGSIEEKHLRPDYLADIKVEVAKAESAAISAEASKTAAAESASTAGDKASEASMSATSAANSASTAAQKEESAAASAANASNSASTATTKANAADASATNAANSAENASNYASTATVKANMASVSAANAATSETNADAYAKKSQSYAVGGTGTRPGEDTDSAKHYYEQIKNMSEGISGALIPIGTITFERLPALENVETGWMYNISNRFTTTADFKEGVGHGIPAGANVYKTADGYWDILAGTPVTSVNGHTGNVNITPADIGLGNVANERQYSASNPQPSVTGSSGSCTGNAATATALTTNAGSASQPVYFSSGKPVACTAYASASVNYANSAGTATTATRATQDGNGNNIVNTYLPKTGGNISGNLIVNGTMMIDNTGKIQLSRTELFSSVDISTNNHVWIKSKTTAGVETLLLGLNNRNNIHIGDYNGADNSPVFMHTQGTQYDFYAASFHPTSSNASTLGNSTHLWKTVYAKTGTINTSDRTKKHDIHEISEVYERLFLKLQPKSFVFNDGDRVHIGAVSQDVEDAMTELGIGPEQFAGFCRDIRYEYKEFHEEDGTPVESSKVPCTDENGNLIYDYALRYQEFIFLTIHMTQRLWEKTDLLEKENQIIKERLEAIESQMSSL